LNKKPDLKEQKLLLLGQKDSTSLDLLKLYSKLNFIKIQLYKIIISSTIKILNQIT